LLPLLPSLLPSLLLVEAALLPESSNQSMEAMLPSPTSSCNILLDCVRQAGQCRA